MTEAPQDIDYIKRILERNAQWAAGTLKLKEPDFFELSGIPPQEPQTLWIGCADSRVPESVIAGGAPPGTIFVHRNIANQLHLHDDNALSVLQYGIDNLRIPNVVIVGHTDCGGVAAALGGVPHHSHAQPEQDAIPAPPDSALTRWLMPLTQLAASFPPPPPPRDVALRRLVEANVKAQIDNLARTRTIINAWAEYDAGDPRPAVWIHGWVYELETKRLVDLHVSRGPPGAKPRK